MTIGDSEYEFRREVLERFSALAERMARIEESLKPIVGNGQPGRIQRIESELHSAAKRIGKLEHAKSYLYGIMAAASGVVAIIVYILEARR